MREREHVRVSISSWETLPLSLTHSIPLTFDLVRGNRNSAAPMPPAMTMLRGRSQADIAGVRGRSFLGPIDIPCLNTCTM